MRRRDTTPIADTVVRDGRRAPPADAANLGVVRPPLVYLLSLLAGTALEYSWPRSFLPRRLATPLGAALVLGAIALFASAVGEFRRSGTPVPGNEPTTALVRTGPYRFSRNPIYVAFSLLQVGIAMWADGLWLLATLVPAFALMAFVVVPREERYLERRLGPAYVAYKRSVRRWL